MKSDLMSGALLMAIERRRPSEGVLVHSDQGSQHESEDYRGVLKQHGVVGSMSRKGNCWDKKVLSTA